MTTQKSIKRLAVFMGWNLARMAGPSGAVLVEEPVTRETRWFDPFTRLDDAMMVAEKIGGLGLEHVPGPGPNYWLASFVKKFIVGPAEAATPAEAITLAALAYLDATEKTK